MTWFGESAAKRRLASLGRVGAGVGAAGAGAVNEAVWISCFGGAAGGVAAAVGRSAAATTTGLARDLAGAAAAAGDADTVESVSSSSASLRLRPNSLANGLEPTCSLLARTPPTPRS